VCTTRLVTVVVDIDDARVRVSLLRDLVHVWAGRQAGPDVEKLPDPGIAEEPDRADQELAVAARVNAHVRHQLEPAVADCPVDREVVLTAEPVRLMQKPRLLRLSPSICETLRKLMTRRAR
jgi:hypothetical protein